MGAWKWWIVQINNLSRVFWVHTRVCIQEDAYWSDAQTPSTWLPSTGSSSSSSSSLWVSEQPYLSRSPTDLKGNLIPAATQSSWPSLRGGTLVWPVNRTLCLSLYTVWFNTNDTADTRRSHAPFYPHTLICLSSFVLGSSSHDQPRINGSNPPFFLAENFPFKLVLTKTEEQESWTMLHCHPPRCRRCCTHV